MSRSVTGRRVRLVGDLAKTAKTAKTAKAGNAMTGFFHWQLDSNLIWLGRITAAQSGCGARGSNPEPTD